MSMLTAIAAAILASPGYVFTAKTKHEYVMEAVFDGFLPILGGNQGKAAISMGIRVLGAEPVEQGLRASSEISTFGLKFNEAPLPFGVDSVRDFFPKSSITVSSKGKILVNEAPDRSLPVRLPGLDVKRLPDITFIPIQLPDGDLAVGTKWEFKRDFGGSEISYTCEAKKIEGDRAEVAVTIRQEFEVLETESLEVTKSEKDAVAKVKTVMTGAGTVVFNSALGAADFVNMKNDAVSTVTPIKGGASEQRKLTTTFNVRREGAAKWEGAGSGGRASAPVRVSNDWLGRLTDGAVALGRGVMDFGSNTVAYMRALWLAASLYMPGLSRSLPTWLRGRAG